MTNALDLDALDFTKSNGLVTVVTQHAVTGSVLMVAHADREALTRCLDTGEMHYTSRSRGPWHKGATSGHVQRIVTLEADCDGDAVLARVMPAGPACHTGTLSCFLHTALRTDALVALDAVIAARAQDVGAASETSIGSEHDATLQPSLNSRPPAGSYTQRLLGNRNLRLKKIGEEAVELAIACADGDAVRGAEEGADLLYHTLVALRAIGVTLADVCRVLEARAA